MQVDAIVYTSETGHTRRYAELLSRETGLPVHSLADAKAALPDGSPVVYMGWLMAGSVKDYRRATKRFDVRCVIGVCLGATGSQTDSVRKSCRLPEDFPIFTVQGGMDKNALKGGYAFGIRMLTRVMKSLKSKTPDQQQMTELLIHGGDFVDAKNLQDAVACIRNS